LNDILYLLDYKKKIVNLVLVQYLFDGPEHVVLVKPHGNSKSNFSHIRTLPSTLSSLKKASKNLLPKFAVSEVSESIGDVTTAPSAGSLPRTRQQASDARRL